MKRTGGGGLLAPLQLFGLMVVICVVRTARWKNIQDHVGTDRIRTVKLEHLLCFFICESQSDTIPRPYLSTFPPSFPQRYHSTLSLALRLQASAICCGLTPLTAHCSAKPRLHLRPLPPFISAV